MNPESPTKTATKPATKAATENVSQAKRTIARALDETGWRNDVSHADLRRINSTLDRLSESERNAVVSQLTDRQLKAWAAESNSRARFGSGGLEAKEKRHLIENLATSLDGRQLVRVSDAFDDKRDARMLGDLIASKSGLRTRLDFIQGVRDQVSRDEDAAVQVAKVIGELGSERPLQGPVLLHQTVVDAAVGSLTDPQLRAVVSAAKQREVYYPKSDLPVFKKRVQYDVKPLADMLRAVGSGSNVALKAKVFQAGSTELKGIAETGGASEDVEGQDRTHREVTRALSELLSSDTNRVTRSLETRDRGGRALTTFAKSLVQDRRTDELKVFITQLQRGDSGKEDPLKRFEAGEGPRGDHRNAQSLGYFMGAVHAGINGISTDRDKQLNFLKVLMTGSLSAGKDVAGVWLSAPAKGLAGLAAAGAGVAGVQTANSIVSGLKSGDKSLREALTDFTFPRTANGDRYEGERAETAYDAAMGRVIHANA